MKIEFYHVDAMEGPNYVPIWKALRDLGVDARLVAVPGEENTAEAGWFDYERLAGEYRQRGISFTELVDPAAHAITTQNASILQAYRGLHLRLMYGMVIYPHVWGLSERSVRPFDAVLTHGPAYTELFTRWKPVEHLPLVGFPRYDDALAGRVSRDKCVRDLALDRARPTVVYFPTWDRNSSLDRFLDGIAALGDEFNVLLKPHHCTIRLEPERMDRISRSGVRVVEDSFGLPELFMVADVVVADTRSGALTEAFMLGRSTVGVVIDPSEFEEWLDPSGVSELTRLCDGPERLRSQIQAVLEKDPHRQRRAAWSRRHVSYLEGNAAVRAAEAIVEYIERGTRPRVHPVPARGKSDPRVSVVLPSYNSIDFLSGAVQSVLHQSFFDFELVIVNDGSTDATAQYLGGLDDERVRVIHQENSGLPRALNRGFRASRGELLTWISADNYCAPIFLEALVGALDARPEAALAVSAFAWVDEVGRITRFTRDQDLSYRSLVSWNPGIASFLYRRTCLEAVGDYDPELEGAEDWDMWLRIVERLDAVYVPEILYYYREHGKSMTVKERPKVCKASARVFWKAVERSGGELKLIDLYPGLMDCAGQEAATAAGCFDFGTRLLQAPFGDVQAACQFLETALSLSPGSPTIGANLAVAYARARRWDEASAISEQLGLQRYPELVAVHDAIELARSENRPETLLGSRLFVLDADTQKRLGMLEKRVFSFTEPGSLEGELPGTAGTRRMLGR